MTQQGRGPGATPDNTEPTEPTDREDHWPVSGGTEPAEQGDNYPTGEVTEQGRGPSITPEDAEPTERDNHTP